MVILDTANYSLGYFPYFEVNKKQAYEITLLSVYPPC
jgi:hypothetical protein